MSDDNKKTPGLGDVLRNIGLGVRNMRSGQANASDAGGNDAPRPAEGKPEPEVDVISATRGDDDLILDDQSQTDQVEAEGQAPSNSLKDMPMRKKLLVAGVVLVGGFLLKNAMMPAELPSVPPASEHPNASAGTEQDADLKLNLKDGGSLNAEHSQTSGLPSPNGSLGQPDSDVGKSLDDLNLNGPLQVESKPSEQSKTTGAAPTDEFGFPLQSDASTPNQPAGPATGNIPAPSTPALPHQDQVAVIGGETPMAAPANPFKEPATNQTENPFGQVETPNSPSSQAKLPVETSSENGAPILAGTPKQNPDSSRQPSLQGQFSDEVAGLNAKLDALGEKVKSLEAQLDEAKKRGAPTAHKASPSPVPKQQAKPQVAHYSKPKASPVAKASVRPKVCVKAVAPPARNCSTCVAHAFIVKSGEETMVGQGDFIDGYRVSITGDRLDLQNSSGQVAHKFWSQPNGCTAF